MSQAEITQAPSLCHQPVLSPSEREEPVPAAQPWHRVCSGPSLAGRCCVSHCHVLPSFAPWVVSSEFALLFVGHSELLSSFAACRRIFITGQHMLFFCSKGLMWSSWFSDSLSIFLKMVKGGCFPDQSFNFCHVIKFPPLLQIFFSLCLLLPLLPFYLKLFG